MTSRSPRDLHADATAAGASLPGSAHAPGRVASLPGRGRAAHPPDVLALLGFTRPPWMRDAACREHPGVDFYAPRDADQARAICARCLVRSECLDQAVANGEAGVWGGTDEAERRDLRKRAA